MDADELRARTRAFALRVIKMAQALPKNSVADVLGKQVLRSATSVGANYRMLYPARRHSRESGSPESLSGCPLSRARQPSKSAD